MGAKNSVEYNKLHMPACAVIKKSHGRHNAFMPRPQCAWDEKKQAPANNVLAAAAGPAICRRQCLGPDDPSLFRAFTALGYAPAGSAPSERHQEFSRTGDGGR